MIGGSRQAALAVKTNEHNITDALEWLQRQHLHQIQLETMKRDLGVVNKQNSLTKRGGLLYHRAIDRNMIMRNQNKQTNSIIKMRRKNNEISRNNLILGRKMQEIFSRKNSNYGEVRFVKKRNNSLEDLGERQFWKGLKINQTSRSNIEIKNSRHLSDQQKQQLMAQISTTSVNEESHDPAATDRSGNLLNKGKGKGSQNFGLVTKEAGPITHFIPNENYVKDPSQFQTLSPSHKNSHFQTAANGFNHSPSKESPRQTVMTQMGHQKRESQLANYLTSSPKGGNQEESPGATQISNNDASSYIDKSTKQDYIKRIKFDKNTKKPNHTMSVTAREGAGNHFVIRKRTEHIPSLTPVNVIKRPDVQGNIPVQRISKDRLRKNSLGGFHTLEKTDNYDFLTTQQPYPSVHSKPNPMAHTSMGYNKEGSRDPQFMKTTNSFLTQTTSPQLYLEVQRPSILKILNQGYQEQPSFNQTFTTAINTYTQNTFKKRHRSLNETARRNEASRIRHENNKVLLKLNSSRPSPDLQVKKLKKDFQKSESLKKQIVMTKYLQRNEISLKNALRRRQEVYDNLPPVISPLYELNSHRRSQRRGLDTIQPKEDNNLQMKQNSQIKINKNESNGKMIMHHDQSVQKVDKQLMKDNSKFHTRHYSVTNSQYMTDNVLDSGERHVQALKQYSTKLGRNMAKIYGNSNFTARKGSLEGLDPGQVHHRAVSGAFITNNEQLNRAYEEQLRQIFSYNQHNHAYKSKQLQAQPSHYANYLRAVGTYQNAALDTTSADYKRRKFYRNNIGFSITQNNFSSYLPDQGLQPEISSHLPLIGNNYKTDQSYNEQDSMDPTQIQQSWQKVEQSGPTKPQEEHMTSQAFSKHSEKSSPQQAKSDLAPLNDHHSGQFQQDKSSLKQDDHKYDQKATTQTRLGGGFGKLAGQTSPPTLRNAAMNNTITTFSSNIVKGTEKSQINTPDLNNGQLAASGQDQTNNLNEKSDQSDDQSYSNNYEEDDLKQRKNFILNERSVPVKKTSPQKQDNKVENQEEGEESENYDENWEDEDQKESSKMADSHAQNSDDDDYNDNEFFDKDKTKNKNADEYFRELEDKKLKDTPEGAQNSNADGGSVFNQTGGNFLNRQPTITSNYKTQQKNQTMMRTTLGGASSGKAGSIALAGTTGQNFQTKNDSEKIMNSQEKTAAQEISSPVRIPKKGGVSLFATQQSNKNAIVAAHSAVNHRESSSRYELYEETNEILLDSKERVNVNSNSVSPANNEQVDIASSMGKSKQSSMAFGFKVNKAEVGELSGLNSSQKRGSKLSNYDTNESPMIGTRAKTDLQAIDEYNNIPKLSPTKGDLQDDLKKSPVQKPPKNFALNEESEPSYSNSEINKSIPRHQLNLNSEPKPTDSEPIDDEDAESAKNKSSTYSEDSYSDDVAEDQSENQTDPEKDSSVIVPLSAAKPGDTSNVDIDDEVSQAPRAKLTRTPLDIQERINRSVEKKAKDKTPTDQEDDYSDDEFA